MAFQVQTASDRHRYPVLVPKGTATGCATSPVPRGTTGFATASGNLVQSRGHYLALSGPSKRTINSKHASPVPQTRSLSPQQASRVPVSSAALDMKTIMQIPVQVQGEQLSEEPASSTVSTVTRLTSSERESSRVVRPVGGVSPRLLGTVNSRFPDLEQVCDPQASQKKTGNNHILTQRSHSNDVDNLLKLLLELDSRNHTLAENLKQFKLTMEGDVRNCAKATMEEVADRKRMEERLQDLWQTSFSKEVDARTAAVCRLDSDIMMLSANVHELREDLQRLTDLMYGGLHSLVQSVQGGADSAPQSQQNGPKEGVPASVSKEQNTERRPDHEKLHQHAKEQTACQERTASLDSAFLPQEDAFNGLSGCNSSAEHRMQHATDILARSAEIAAAEIAAALREQQLAGMHNECCSMIEKLLDETVQGCVKYSIVKEATSQALNALGKTWTDALGRDGCGTLRKIEEWRIAEVQTISGNAVQSNRTVLLGSLGTAAGAHGGCGGNCLATSMQAPRLI